MDLKYLDDHVQVFNNETNLWSMLESVAKSNSPDEAFFVCDVGDIVRKHYNWKTAMPRVVPYYAVKCNDNLSAIATLSTLGANFDCASESEINNVLAIGVDPNRIIFANPTKLASHIRHAARVGVQMMTFDSETELRKINQWHPYAHLVLRIRCDDPEAKFTLGIKFGCNHATEAPRLLEMAREMGLNVIGVSFHVGSGCTTPSIFHTAISYARQVFDYAKSLGFDFTLLDIGGGFPGVQGTSINKFADVINLALEEYFPDPSIEVIGEPGTFYVASAYILACNIHSMKQTQITDAVSGQTKPHSMYYINDGVYGCLSCVRYVDRMYPRTLKDHNRQIAKLTSSSIWGPTCDALDQISPDVLLPELEIGDWIIFEDMGAYSIPLATPFNGFTVPKMHMVVNESVWSSLKGMLPLAKNHLITDNN